MLRVAPAPVALLGVVVASALLVTSPVHAQTAQTADEVKASCLDAYAEAQKARKEQKFTEARADLRACASESCPGLVRADCTAWLLDVERLQPSVVFDADVDGTQTAVAHVSIDGQLVTERIDGRTVEVDPGMHVFRIEVDGFPPNEQTIILAEGAKGRIVSASFERPKQKLIPIPKVRFDRPIPLSLWITGGVTAAAVLSTAIFGSLAVAEKAADQGSCSPVCSDAQLSSLRTYMRGADVSLGIAGVGAIAGLVLFLKRPAVQRPEGAGWPPSLSFQPAPGGGLVAAHGSF